MDFVAFVKTLQDKINVNANWSDEQLLKLFFFIVKYKQDHWNTMSRDDRAIYFRAVKEIAYILSSDHNNDKNNSNNIQKDDDTDFITAKQMKEQEESKQEEQILKKSRTRKSN
jgi:hypothetical protein